MANVKVEYSLEKYLNYEKQLKEHMLNNSKQIVFNDSLVHAAMVVSSILEHAKTNNNNLVNMYCGEFSLFRDSAKKKLDNLWESVKPDDVDSHLYREWEEFDPYKKLMLSLSEYLQEERRVNVIVENDISGIVKEDSWLILNRFVENGKIVFKKMGIPLGLNHFMVVGNCYRRENNDKEKTALCCFNDERTSVDLRNKFQLLSFLSESHVI